MADTPDRKDGEAPDLRFSSHVQQDVHVERNLSGDGHLARGSLTRMSRLNMSVRALPRDDGERDPVFAERPAEPVANVVSVPATVPTLAGTPQDAPGFMQWIARLFGSHKS